MGASASSLPAKLNAEDATKFAGDKMDVEKFNALKDAEGFITKEQFLSTDGPLSPSSKPDDTDTPDTDTPALTALTKDEANAAAASDMANAEAKGIDWKACHSVVRWNKPLDEIAAVLTSPFCCNCVDTKNGNYPIHIAAQNGHAELVRWLVENGARTEVQNGTGQTAMHMAVSYDYDSVTEYLKSQAANFDICNWAENPAKFGIEGEKDPSDPWFMLEECCTTALALAAFAAVEAAAAKDPKSVEKAKFAMCGMQLKKGKKKLPAELWTPECQAKFAGLMGALA